MVGIGSVLYLALAVLVRYPHLFNYLQEVTAENAKELYRISSRMMRSLNTIIVWIFAYLSINTVRIGLGYQNDLGYLFAILVIPLTMALLIYYFYRVLKV